MELYRNQKEAANTRRQIIDIVTEAAQRNLRDMVNQIAQIFATFRYRDDSDGWVEGIPFSTDPQELNTILATITAQGDELATKRLLRKLTELTNGFE